ncbi:Catalase isozyme 2 [Hordeum vulgare]|nr:Catalase isozyme 2 [Hordeum vulgare]
MDFPGTGPHSPDNAPRPHAGTDSASSLSDVPRRWFGKYTNGHRPSSMLAQMLVGARMPLIKCDDCPVKVVYCVSTMLNNPDECFSSAKKMRMDVTFGFGKKNTSMY